MAEAQRCLANADAVAMETLLMELGGIQYKENYTEQILQTVLFQDEVSIANVCFSARDIQDWSDANAEHLIAECPKLFAQWAAPAARQVRAIAKFFAKTEDAAKCNILEGRDLSLPAQSLYALLKKDASLWHEFPISWIGEKSSTLRATASAAGWAPERLPGMLSGRWVSSVEHWGNVFDYPCALCLANDAVATMDFNESRAKGGGMTNHPGWMVGKSAFMQLPSIKFSADANPVDMALAEIIKQRVRMDYVLEKNPDVVEVSLGVREQLTQIVDMHLALGCLNLLVEALARDTCPGLQVQIESEIVLPEFDSPTH